MVLMCMSVLFAGKQVGQALHSRRCIMKTPSDTDLTARLALEDGTIFHGQAFAGSTQAGTWFGEVVFNTALTGYQEAISDPSYAGQILVMTATQIGNYGVVPDDVESGGPRVAGFVVRQMARRWSNCRADQSLEQWLGSGDGQQAAVPAITGIDTRALVRRLRTQGVMRGAICSDSAVSDQALIKSIQAANTMEGRNLVDEVAPTASGIWVETLGQWGNGGANSVAKSSRMRVVAMDCGAKFNIYRNLCDIGCDVEAVTAGNLAQRLEDLIEHGEIDGLMVSNGPGDPAAVTEGIEALSKVAGRIPTFGICLGHQLLALALGATTYKLKFGHRGANQPVRNLLTGRVEITSQNHGFCVDEGSLEAAGLEVTHRHLNDGTVAGFRHPQRPIFSVQYHPEASPGPHDAQDLFKCFRSMMERPRPLDTEMLLESSSMAST